MARYLLKEIEGLCRELSYGELVDLAECWVSGLDRSHRARVAAEYLTVPWSHS